MESLPCGGGVINKEGKMFRSEPKSKSIVVIASLALVASASMLFAAALLQQDHSTTTHDSMQANHMPGKGQKFLAQHCGNWTWSSTAKMSPGGESKTYTGEMKSNMSFDGRYMFESFEGDRNQGPHRFEALNITGYDNKRKVFVSSWLDNTMTGIFTAQGVPNDDWTEINWVQDRTNQMTGKIDKLRVVETFHGPDKFSIVEYWPGSDGKEFKAVEIQFSRLDG